MMRACLVVLALWMLPELAMAQAPAALPPQIEAVIELPGTGPARFLNVTVEMGALPWSIEGCVSSARGACSATSQVVLDDAARAELVQRIAAVQQHLRCPAPPGVSTDPHFTLTTPGETWRGSLPRDPAAIPSRTGTCAASAALAWWIVQRFGAA